MRASFHIVILAGGKGTRLWPLSEGDRPKQFLTLPYEKTLIEQAYERALLLTDKDKIWVITLESQLTETEKLLPFLHSTQIIAEPYGRNTAPAACLATMNVEKIMQKPETILLLTADHYVPDHSAFVKAMLKGVRRAQDGESLLTFGLKIKAPRTEFGYIEVYKGRSKDGIRKVQRFVEKPPLVKAKQFARSERFFWNSGMFAWRSDFFLKEMSKHVPTIIEPLKNLNWSSAFFKDELKRTYEKLPSISIDYALLEKSSSVEGVPSNFQWSDLGTWAAVAETLEKRKKDNVMIGKAKVIEGQGNFVRTSDKEVVLFGVNNLVVVETPQATLVTTKEKSRELKRLLEKL